MPDIDASYKGRHNFPRPCQVIGWVIRVKALGCWGWVMVGTRENPWAGRPMAPAQGEAGIPPFPCAGSIPHAAHVLLPILPGSSSPAVGFQQSESVPPTWLLVPGDIASPPKHPSTPCGPQGLLPQP